MKILSYGIIQCSTFAIHETTKFTYSTKDFTLRLYGIRTRMNASSGISIQLSV